MTAASIKKSIAFTLLIAAAALSCWSIFLSNQTKIIVTQNNTGEPDAFLEGVTAVIMNKEGKPSLKVETPRMVHYVENNTTEFITPHITIFRDSPEPWHIDAKFAKAIHGITEITFWDDVNIHHLADKTNPVTTMQTSSLTILPDLQIAKTSAPVTVSQPDTLIRAIGMLANWKDGTVKLLSQAREEYVPRS